jgi:hypothetical protein
MFIFFISRYYIMENQKTYAKKILYFFSTIVVDKKGVFSLEDISEENFLKIKMIFYKLFKRLENEKSEILKCLEERKISDDEINSITNLAQTYFTTNDDITKEFLLIKNNICPNYVKGGRRKKTLKVTRLNKKKRNLSKKIYRGGQERDVLTPEELRESCPICLEFLSESPAMVLHPGGDGAARHICCSACAAMLINDAKTRNVTASCPICRIPIPERLPHWQQNIQNMIQQYINIEEEFQQFLVRLGLLSQEDLGDIDNLSMPRKIKRIIIVILFIAIFLALLPRPNV